MGLNLLEFGMFITLVFILGSQRLLTRLILFQDDLCPFFPHPLTPVQVLCVDSCNESVNVINILLTTTCKCQRTFILQCIAK